jgi:hypothetical protein
MAQDIINTFPAKFEAAYNAGIREDLGFQSSKEEDPLSDGRPAHRLWPITKLISRWYSDDCALLRRTTVQPMASCMRFSMIPPRLTNGQRVGESDWVMK